jgi:hypothetical protein
LKLYQYILGFYQLENTIILVKVLFSCTCNHILEKCTFMHIKTCGSSILCNEVKKNPFLLIIVLIIVIKYIHAFNLLRLILWIFSNIYIYITKWHILPCLCFGAMVIGTIYEQFNYCSLISSCHYAPWCLRYREKKLF